MNIDDFLFVIFEVFESGLSRQFGPKKAARIKLKKIYVFSLLIYDFSTTKKQLKYVIVINFIRAIFWDQTVPILPIDILLLFLLAVPIETIQLICK